MRTLNLAIPITFLLGYTVGLAVYGICAEALLASGMTQDTAESIGGCLALFVTITAALIVAHRKAQIIGAPTPENRSGHMLIAIANTAALLTTAGPIAASLVMNDLNIRHYMWLAVPVLFLNLFLWPIGWARATSH